MAKLRRIALAAAIRPLFAWLLLALPSGALLIVFLDRPAAAPRVAAAT